MALVQTNSPGDKKKLIAAVVLGVIAVAVLSYAMFSSPGGSSKPVGTAATPTAQRSPAPPRVQDTPTDDTTLLMQPIEASWSVPAVADPKRNIFAFYEPPPAPSPVVRVQVPSPTPPPPLLLASLSPANVYARTADFTLEIAGDKFTPAVKVVVDGRELPTRFIGPQQLAATVSAAMISNPGTRQVLIRNSDGSLYSNPAMLNVADPPKPNYTYVGIIAKPHYDDWAVLQDKNTKEVINVQRGDVVGGRFRVTSISERELVVTDTTLKIKHTMAFTRDPSVSNQIRQPQRAEDDDP